MVKNYSIVDHGLNHQLMTKPGDGGSWWVMVVDGGLQCHGLKQGFLTVWNPKMVGLLHCLFDNEYWMTWGYPQETSVMANIAI